MNWSKEEINDELEHKKQLLRAFRARLRPLQIQAAQRGASAPPEILTEIGTLTDQIRTHEDDIQSLESLAAEGQTPMAEVEYRLLIAETWDTPRGRPTTSGYAQIELARLRLGIPPEKSSQIENEVRISLVEEVFSIIDMSPLFDHDTKIGHNTNQIGEIAVNISNVGDAGGGSQYIQIEKFEVSQNIVITDPLISTIRLLGKAIRLNRMATQHLFVKSLPSPLPRALETTNFSNLLLSENRVWINSDESDEFKTFIHETSEYLR